MYSGCVRINSEVAIVSGKYNQRSLTRPVKYFEDIKFIAIGMDMTNKKKKKRHI